MLQADGVRAGEKVGEAAGHAAAKLEELRPGDPKAEANAAVEGGRGPTIQLEGPPGVSLEGLLFEVRFGDAEKVFQSDANGVVVLEGVPEEGYGIIGIKDGSGLEVVGLSTSPLAPSEEPEADGEDDGEPTG